MKYLFDVDGLLYDVLLLEELDKFEKVEAHLRLYYIRKRLHELQVRRMDAAKDPQKVHVKL